MKKMFNIKVIVAMFICFAAITYMIGGTKTPVAAADTAGKIKTSYAQCENNDEDVWYEMVDDVISEKVVAYEEEGKTYTISEECEIDDGFFTAIDTVDESNVIAGITIDGTNYVVTLTSDQAISNEDAENTLYDVFEEIIIATEGEDA
ncbi:MAG: hypothetical protein MJ087_01280 [Lachnospiraceae bacterium]|nr:hypothetical protein [Lachnospiraceae bacterium]